MDESTRGAVGCEKRRCHEGEPGVGASASVSSHSSDRSGSDDSDDGGGSYGNGPNDKNTYGENGWMSGWSERNGSD